MCIDGRVPDVVSGWTIDSDGAANTNGSFMVVGVLEFNASEFHTLIDDAPNGSAGHLAFLSYVSVAIAEGFEFIGLEGHFIGMSHGVRVAGRVFRVGHESSSDCRSNQGSRLRE